MATFSALRTRAAVRFRDPTNAIITDTVWKDYVNEAYRRVLGATPFWPWNKGNRTTLTFAAGDNTETLPTDSWRITAVFNNTDGIVMRQETGYISYRERFPFGSDSPGVPTEWQQFGHTLEVYPFPAVSTSVIVDYTLAPSAMSADGDLPVFPAQYHDVLVEYALAQAYQDDGAFDQAQAHEQRAQAIVKEMMMALLQGTGDHYPQIRDTWFGERL